MQAKTYECPACHGEGTIDIMPVRWLVTSSKVQAIMLETDRISYDIANSAGDYVWDEESTLYGSEDEAVAAAREREKAHPAEDANEVEMTYGEEPQP